jgi:hypothetical protein
VDAHHYLCIEERGVGGLSPAGAELASAPSTPPVGRYWIARRGGVEAAEERDGIEQVRLYLAKYGESRFDPVDGDVDRSVNLRVGWRRGAGECRQ